MAFGPRGSAATASRNDRHLKSLPDRPIGPSGGAAVRTRSADYMRILVVDDDDAIRASIRRTLGREIDADVSEASNGADALDHLVRYQCDLVLLDIQMPGMNGIKTLQAIRRSPNRAALPVIMLTGTADEQHVREAASLGVQDYMLKPVEPEALVLRLSEVLMRTTRGPAAGVPAEVLTLEKHDRVLVIEPDPDLLRFLSNKLSEYCHVDRVSAPPASLQAHAQKPPVAVFLGGSLGSAPNAILPGQIPHPPATARRPGLWPGRSRTARHPLRRVRRRTAAHAGRGRVGRLGRLGHHGGGRWRGLPRDSPGPRLAVPDVRRGRRRPPYVGAAPGRAQRVVVGPPRLRRGQDAVDPDVSRDHYVGSAARAGQGNGIVAAHFGRPVQRRAPCRRAFHVGCAAHRRESTMPPGRGQVRGEHCARPPVPEDTLLAGRQWLLVVRLDIMVLVRLLQRRIATSPDAATPVALSPSAPEA